MSLDRLLHARAEAGTPVTLGILGAGRLGTEVMAQARRVPGLCVVGVADWDAGRVAAAASEAGWPDDSLSHASPGHQPAGTTAVTGDPSALIAAPGLAVVLDTTGQAAPGVRHARACREHGRHLVTANMAADSVAGPVLAAELAREGLVYSLAYGDQPALIHELVSWARAAGFDVAAAGKGTQYLEHFHLVTPETVWEIYGIASETARRAGLDPRTYTASLDGTKAALEMAATANATGLAPPPAGLRFPPVSRADLAHVMRPEAVGGRLGAGGQLEAASSLERDGRPVDDALRHGVFVILHTPDGHVGRTVRAHGLPTDVTGRHAAFTRPAHLAGLEMTVSVAAAALRGESTGTPDGRRAEVVAVAKRDLHAGEVLDGDGGGCAWGMLLPAARADELDGLPIALSGGLTLNRPVRRGEVVTRHDATPDPADPAVAAWHAAREAR